MVKVSYTLLKGYTQVTYIQQDGAFTISLFEVLEGGYSAIEPKVMDVVELPFTVRSIDANYECQTVYKPVTTVSISGHISFENGHSVAIGVLSGTVTLAEQSKTCNRHYIISCPVGRVVLYGQSCSSSNVSHFIQDGREYYQIVVTTCSDISHYSAVVTNPSYRVGQWVGNTLSFYRNCPEGDCSKPTPKIENIPFNFDSSSLLTLGTKYRTSFGTLVCNSSACDCSKTSDGVYSCSSVVRVSGLVAGYSVQVMRDPSNLIRFRVTFAKTSSVTPVRLLLGFGEVAVVPDTARSSSSCSWVKHTDTQYGYSCAGGFISANIQDNTYDYLISSADILFIPVYPPIVHSAPCDSVSSEGKCGIVSKSRALASFCLASDLSSWMFGSKAFTFRRNTMEATVVIGSNSDGSDLLAVKQFPQFTLSLPKGNVGGGFRTNHTYRLGGEGFLEFKYYESSIQQVSSGAYIFLSSHYHIPSVPVGAKGWFVLGKNKVLHSGAVNYYVESFDLSLVPSGDYYISSLFFSGRDAISFSFWDICLRDVRPSDTRKLEVVRGDNTLLFLAPTKGFKFGPYVDFSAPFTLEILLKASASNCSILLNEVFSLIVAKSQICISSSDGVFTCVNQDSPYYHITVLGGYLYINGVKGSVLAGGRFSKLTYARGFVGWIDGFRISNAYIPYAGSKTRAETLVYTDRIHSFVVDYDVL